jgi:hypothetical protein
MKIGPIWSDIGFAVQPAIGAFRPRLHAIPYQHEGLSAKLRTIS